MTAAARRVGKGPERPTLTEWLIGFLPVPFIVGSLLLALLFGIPRAFLGALLDTGNLDAILALFPPGEGGLLVLVLIVDVSVYLAVPLATRYMRRQVVKAKEAISALLPQGEETYLRVFGQISSFWPPLLLGVVFIVFLVLLPGTVSSLGPFSTVLNLVFLLFFPILGAFVWIYVRSTVGLYQLGRGSLRMKSYLQDPVLGLRPLGSLSFALAWPYLATLGIAALWISLGVPGPGILFIVALVIVGVVMFFLPLYAVHRRMVRERERAHASVREHLWERAEKVDALEREGSDPTLLDLMNRLARRLARLAEASSLDREARRIDEIYDWPFDTRIVGRLAVLTLTVVAVLLTRYAATLFGI